MESKFQTWGDLDLSCFVFFSGIIGDFVENERDSAVPDSNTVDIFFFMYRLGSFLLLIL